MRTARSALALLLALAIPLRAETTTDPLWYLLSTYVLAPDARAVEAQGEGPADAKGLASLQADLLVLTDGLEGFRDEAQVKESLERLKPRMSPELRPFFKDRASSLDAIYRTLAVTDYTWAQRFPEPPCEPLEARRKLLASGDGLFQSEKGEASPWLVALLGPQAEGKSAEQALDQASSQAKLSGAEYEKLRSRVRKLTMALASDKAVGAARSKLYCTRAAAFTDLAAAQRVKDAALISAGRVVAQKPEESVFVVVWKNHRAAATLVKTKNGAVLVTDAAIVADTDHPNLFAYSANAKPLQVTATVARRHPELGVAVLTYAEDPARPSLSLAEATPAKDELVTAVGHTMISGLWTKTSGLVTKVGEVSFQTDAAISPELSGGPVLNEAGQVAGILVLRSADTEEGRWPVAIPAPVLVRWLNDPAFNFPTVHAETTEDDGTAAVLTRARLTELTEVAGAWNIPPLPPPPRVPNGVCVQNCSDARTPKQPSASSGASSYNSGSSELGQELGKLGAMILTQGLKALFRGLSKLSKGTSKTPSPSKNTASTSKAQSAAPRATQAKKDPPKLTRISLEVIPATAAPGDKVKLLAHITLSDAQASKENIVVRFKATPQTLVHFDGKLEAKTDSAGIATLTVTLRRDHGVRAVKAGDTKAVKTKSFDAHGALDEEARAMHAASSGATEPGIEDEKDQTIEFEGAATFGLSLTGTAMALLSLEAAVGIYEIDTSALLAITDNTAFVGVNRPHSLESTAPQILAFLQTHKGRVLISPQALREYLAPVKRSTGETMALTNGESTQRGTILAANTIIPTASASAETVERFRSARAAFRSPGDADILASAAEHKHILLTTDKAQIDKYENALRENTPLPELRFLQFEGNSLPHLRP